MWGKLGGYQRGCGIVGYGGGQVSTGCRVRGWSRAALESPPCFGPNVCWAERSVASAQLRALSWGPGKGAACVCVPAPGLVFSLPSSRRHRS